MIRAGLIHEKIPANIWHPLHMYFMYMCMFFIRGICVAVCCSVLQCVAVCCSVLQCVAVCSLYVVYATFRNTHVSPFSSCDVQVSLPKKD